jgi:hypothetical protein
VGGGQLGGLARYRRVLASSHRASTRGARSGRAAMRWALTGPRSMVGSGSARPLARSAYVAGVPARCRLVSPSVHARPRVGACGSGTASSSPTSRRATTSRAARVAGRSSGTAAALTGGWDGCSVFMAASERVGCVKAFMQLAGTHAAVRRVGHVDGSCFADPRQRRSARQADRAPVGQAPDVDDAGCSAGRTLEGPAPDALVPRSGASPGTQRGPCEPSAPRTRLLWALARA